MATQETYKMKVLSDAKSLGTDLLEADFPPNSSDKEKMYGGKIYSISGKDKRFPKLPADIFDTEISLYPFVYGVSEPIYSQNIKRKKVSLLIGEHQTTTQERIKETITYIILLFISFFLLAWAFSGWLVAGRILFVICCLIFIFLLKEVWTRKTTKEYKRVYEDELTEKEKELLKK
ncbi:MAG: hypothetical protein ACLR9S_01405 [Lachnospiraceae bacterium]